MLLRVHALLLHKWIVGVILLHVFPLHTFLGSPHLGLKRSFSMTGVRVWTLKTHQNAIIYIYINICILYVFEGPDS